MRSRSIQTGLFLLAVVALAAAPVCAQAGPTFECQGPVPVLVPNTPIGCEGLTAILTGSQNGDPYISNVVTSGCFPTEGAQHLIVPGTNPGSLPAPPPGGPLTWPLPAGFSQVQLPIALSTTGDVTITWDFYSSESGAQTTWNDGMSIDIVDPATGLSIQNIAYADTSSALAVGGCTASWQSPNETYGPQTGTDMVIAGPQTTCVPVGALPPGAFISIVAWTGGDDFYSSAAFVDNVVWNTGCSPVSTPNMPNSAEASMSFTGSSCLPVGAYPQQTLVVPGGQTDLTISTSANGTQPYTLVATPGVGTVTGPGLGTTIGVIDLDLTAILSGNLEYVIDGISSANLIGQLLGNTGSTATRTIPLNMPAAGAGTLAAFQAACIDPTSPVNLTLTAATQLDFDATPPLSGAWIGTTPVPWPSGGVDDTVQIVFTSGLMLPFYGTTYSDVHINSAGNLTFGAGNNDWGPSAADFLSQEPRIAPLWYEWGAGGTAKYTETTTALTVSFENWPVYGGTDSNNFAVTIDNAGSISFAYGGVVASGGFYPLLAGISPGASSPVGPATGASLDLSAQIALGGYSGASTEALFEVFAGSFDLAPPCGPAATPPFGQVNFIPLTPTVNIGDAGYQVF